MFTSIFSLIYLKLNSVYIAFDKTILKLDIHQYQFKGWYGFFISKLIPNNRQVSIQNWGWVYLFLENWPKRIGIDTKMGVVVVNFEFTKNASWSAAGRYHILVSPPVEYLQIILTNMRMNCVNMCILHVLKQKNVI